jgi:glyoxylase-like metal-dependent hydrolase (beta-lactamase superfamily II)
MLLLWCRRLLLLVAWAWSAAPYAADCDARDRLAFQPVLPGVSVVHGLWPSVHAGRAAHAATTVVLGEGAEVTVVDPGPTRQAGLALQRALKCLRQARVVALVNTHAHAEQVLANSAFRVSVAATAGTASAMQLRCPDCLAAMTSDLGAKALKGTRIVWPDRTLTAGDLVQAGGRAWQVLEMRDAHTESDLVLWSETDRLALVGGLVDGGRLPVLAQGRVLGWLQALDALQTLQPQWLVGQHLVSGPAQVQAALQMQREYLCGLVHYAWRGLDSGWSEAEAMKSLELPERWVTSSAAEDEARRQQHQFNQLRAWREMEQGWMDQMPRPASCGSTPDVGR